MNTPERRLYFPGLYSGYSNLRMSLDIAVVLAGLTGRTLVPYRMRMARRHAQAASDAAVHEPMVLPELFELPVPHDDALLLKTWVSAPRAASCRWPGLHDAVFVGDGQARDGADFEAFRNGRRHVLALTAQQHEAAELHVQAEALAHYAHFFRLGAAQRATMLELVRRLRPKPPYRQAVDALCAQLGARFNAIHLRRGDLLTHSLSQRGFSRAGRVTGAEIVANLAQRMGRDLPLVVCTDGDVRDELFVPIAQHFRQAVFLHQHLHSDAARAVLQALPRYDEDVDALLTQGVAARAEVFAGTLFSTFTALIHRQRAWQCGEAEFLFCYDDFGAPQAPFARCAFTPMGDGPYSWNRCRLPVSPDAYSWLREWPECAGLTVKAQ